MSSIVSPHASEIDLLEVFCSSHSKLADQVTQLGGKSRRYGLDQGDLITSEGRRDLVETQTPSCLVKPSVWTLE